MLVATRDLNVFGGLVRKGEPVPFLDRWDKCALQSNINIGWIKEVPDEVVVQNVVVAAEEIVEPEPAPQAVERIAFGCKVCSKSFHSARGLTLHARSHRK